MAFGRGVAAQYGAKHVRLHVRHVEGTGAAVPLDQRENRVHVRGAAADLGSWLATDIGHIGFKGFSFAAHRGGHPIAGALHDLADAMSEEPSGLHAAIKRPLNLPGADALLAGDDQLNGLQPRVQREMAVLENRADPHGKGLAAGVALAEAGTAALAGQAANGLLINVSAMRANRAFRPKVGFDEGKSGFLVVEMRGGQNGMGHDESPCQV